MTRDGDGPHGENEIDRATAAKHQATIVLADVAGRLADQEAGGEEVSRALRGEHHAARKSLKAVGSKLASLLRIRELV